MPQWLTGWWSRLPLGDMFGADLRSLALFRMALGWIVLIDLVERSSTIREHYSDAGVLPRGTLLSTLNQWRWSIMLANGTVLFQTAVFLVAIVAAMLLLLGYRTRLATIVTWVAVISIQSRNPLLLSGADTLIRVLLFWSMFLPLGAKWSIDAAFGKEPATHRPSWALSMGTAGLFLQIAFMYIFTALLKSSPVWRTEGTALYYALGAGHVTRPWAQVLLEFPTALRMLTHLTLILEFVAPVLLFFPWRTGPIRTVAIAMIVSLQLGIFVTMDVGVFTWASTLCMVAFLPAWFWNALIPAAAARLPWLEPFRARIASIPRQIIQQGRAQVASLKGVPSAVRGADHPEPAPQPAGITHAASSRILKASLVGNLLAALSLVLVLFWNISTVSSLTLPKEARSAAFATGLYQTWSMFAPKPPAVTQWYVVRGVLENGQDVDLMKPIVDGDISQVAFVSWERPEDIVNGLYGNKYWRKYFEAIGKPGNSTERLRFAAYTCRTWNAAYGGDVALERVEIYRLTQRTLLDGKSADISKKLIDDFGCT